MSLASSASDMLYIWMELLEGWTNGFDFGLELCSSDVLAKSNKNSMMHVPVETSERLNSVCLAGVPPQARLCLRGMKNSHCL